MLKLKILINLIKKLPDKSLTSVRIFTISSFVFLAVNANAIVSTTSPEMLKEAITLRESGKNGEAVKILNSLVVQFGKHKRVHLELLINYIKLEQVDNAKNTLLKIENLPLSKQEKKSISALKNRVKMLEKVSEKILTKKISKHKFSSQITALSGVDEFTSSLSLYDFFDFGDIDDLGVLDDYDNNYLDERNSDVDEKDKISYSAFQAKFRHRYMSDKIFDFISIPSTFNWKNNITLYQKLDNEEYSERYKQAKIDSNFQVFRKDKWLFNVRLRGRFHYINGEKLLSERSAELSLSLPIYQDARIKFGVEKRKKTFAQNIDFLNASVLTPWIEYTLKFNEHYKFYIGSRYRKNNAKDEFYSYDNLNYYSSFRYYHSNQFSAYITWNDNGLNFDIDDPTEVSWSQETKSSIALGMKYQFNNDFSTGIKVHSVTKNILPYEFEKITNKWKRVEAFISYRF